MATKSQPRYRLVFSSSLELHSFQVSIEISFFIKGIPDCPWVLQKPGLPHLWCFQVWPVVQIPTCLLKAGIFLVGKKKMKHFTLAAVIFQPEIIALRTEQVHRMCVWIWCLNIYLFFIHCRTGRKGNYMLSAGVRTCIKNEDACNYPSAGLLNLCVLGMDIFWCVHIKSWFFFHVVSVKCMVCCLSQIHWLNNQAYTTLIC